MTQWGIMPLLQSDYHVLLYICWSWQGWTLIFILLIFRAVQYINIILILWYEIRYLFDFWISWCGTNVFPGLKRLITVSNFLNQTVCIYSLSHYTHYSWLFIKVSLCKYVVKAHCGEIDLEEFGKKFGIWFCPYNPALLQMKLLCPSLLQNTTSVTGVDLRWRKRELE